LIASATPEASSPPAAASFHLRFAPGRANSQSPIVATTMKGMLACSIPWKSEPSQWWWNETS
jgi:hypothetical protein